MYTPFQSSSDYFHDGISFIMEGQIVFTSDPDQMGRCKVWIPALDGENIDVEALPWASYASPISGFTVDFPAGGTPVKNDSHAAYGFWAIPKIGTTVYVFFVNANPNKRCFFASSTRMHRNRSLPAGRNFDAQGRPGPWGDAGDEKGNLEPIQPAFDNLRQQFQNKLAAPQAVSRGGYERQVAQAQTTKDGKEGYSASVVDKGNLDPQTYCWTTPGRHAIIMQDNPKYSRLRVKTAEGHQVIFDDANERIYVSTATGKAWIEMDLDGHIHMFGAQSLSFRAGVDINFEADRDINFEAQRAFNVKANTGDIRMSTGKTLNLSSTGNTLVTACGDINIVGEKDMKITSTGTTHLKSGASTLITASSSLDLTGGAQIVQSGGVIHLNGPTARKASAGSCAAPAQPPSIVPGHEPWVRPASPNKRGTNWKE